MSPNDDIGDDAMRARSPRDVGLLVRERRRHLSLSQAELAARVGVSRPWLVSVEQGHPRAELGKLLALLAELDLTLDLSPAGARTSATQHPATPVDLDALLAAHDDRFGGAR